MRRIPEDRHDWYKLWQWQKRAHRHLRMEPLCRFCLERGRVTPATIADHVTPHRGDWNAFLLGELQSLCHACHNRDKRIEEIRGYRLDVGEDGWPLDPKHPANKSRTP
jgi:hypothetical protein